MSGGGRRATADATLVARVRAGDEAAFAAIVERYQRPLLAYARRSLRDDGLAEDVLQEAFWRAHRALRRDDRELQLRPWLFRLVRNCCLDEISRAAPKPLALEDAAAATPESQEPDAIVDRRLRVRRLLTDIADLPAAQRHALVRRELDGLSHEQVAAELGITPRACISLVYRARTSLGRAREARTVSCDAIRQELLRAHDQRRRASVAAHRHLAGCADCREFRRGLGTVRGALSVLQPGPLLFGVALAGKPLLAGKATALKAAGLTAGAALATGAAGVVVIGAGHPSPIAIHSRAVAQRVAAGAPVPAGTAVVRRTIALRARRTHAPVALRCPAGLRVADVLPVQGGHVTVTLRAGSTPHADRDATLVFSTFTAPRDRHVTVSVFCKRPDATGSLVARPATAAAHGRGGWARAGGMLHGRPASAALTGGVHAQQPLTIVAGTRDGRWLQVVADDGQRGWLRASDVRG